MKRTYTPSLEELSRKYGESYFTVSVGKRHQKHDSFLICGTLEDVVGTMDATIYGIDPDAADLSAWSADISHEGHTLVFMPSCENPDSAETAPQPEGDRYEVHQVSAMMQDDESWYYNETWKMFEYTTTAADRARAFRRALARFGISFIKGRTRTEYDGDVYEIVDRKTGEPLFCAYMMED